MYDELFRGTNSPYGHVGVSGIYKVGRGQKDNGYTRLNNQVRWLNKRYGGPRGSVYIAEILVDNLPSVAQSRIIEADYIKLHALNNADNRPANDPNERRAVGNRSW